MHKLIIISGPSCAGKSPLLKAFSRSYPHLARRVKKLVLYNSRSPRPGEKEGLDYFFRPRKEVRDMAKKRGFIVMAVRGDLQAIDVASLSKTLRSSDVVFEGNPFIGGRLLSLPALAPAPKQSVFISPLSIKDVARLTKRLGDAGTQKFVAGLMKKKLLARARRQGRKLNDCALKDISRRAKSAFVEMKKAWQYDIVIVNRDGEDSNNWRGPEAPRGDARKTLKAFASFLKGGKPAPTSCPSSLTSV